MTLPLEVLEVHEMVVLVRPADGPAFSVDRAAIAGPVEVGTTLTVHTDGGKTHYTVTSQPRPV